MPQEGKSQNLNLHTSPIRAVKHWPAKMPALETWTRPWLRSPGFEGTASTRCTPRSSVAPPDMETGKGPASCGSHLPAMTVLAMCAARKRRDLTFATLAPSTLHIARVLFFRWLKLDRFRRIAPFLANHVELREGFTQT